MAEAFNEFLNFFLDEALDALALWEKSCLDLEKDQSMEAREELYRSAHNLKSGSGAVGLTEFNELVHKVEDLISKVLNGQIPPSPQTIKIFLQTHSTLVTWIEKLKAGENHHPVTDIQTIFREVSHLLQEPNTTVPHITIPETQAIDVSPAALLLRSLQQPEIAAESTAPRSDSQATEEQPAKVVAVDAIPAPATHEARAHNSKSQESIRVAAAKLDQLIQLVGELSTQQAIVWHGRQNSSLNSKSCDNAIQLIQKIAKDLQSLALSLRLQPLQSLFQRLERTGRDLARSQEKKIDVVMRGDYVEVDRTVIERIADAMNHVIRNAIDHGVESPAERQQQGKKASATLCIEAVQETSGVMITVTDDGRGLNTEKIQKKAIERGIIKSDANLASQDIHRLIFHAGLSTAEKITDISGRGVGMDVVKNSVETIGGSIHVSSQEMQGTTFAITLPATLSIIDALIISMHGSRYAIPVQDVSEIIDTHQSRIEAVPGYGRLLSLREKLIPVDLLAEHLPKRQKFEATACLAKSEALTAMIRPALIIRGGAELLAFEVDSILGQQPVTVRRLPQLIATIPGYTGGTILGDGDPCVILNLPALVTKHFDRINQGASQGSVNRLENLSDQKLEASNDIENRFLVFEFHHREFAVPLLNIKEILRNQFCEPLVGAASHVIGCINVRGILIPVMDIGVILGLPAMEGVGDTDIVIHDEQMCFALRVHRVEAVTHIQALESRLTEKHQEIIPGLYGYMGTGIHDGRPVLMLDLRQTVRQWEEAQLAHLSQHKLVGNMLEVS
jgi:two-component system chemotaxis sensor kinase CheA